MLTDHELSAMVAEKVTGWCLIQLDTSTSVWQLNMNQAIAQRKDPPDFATDQGLALEAALKMSEYVEISKWASTTWRARLWDGNSGPDAFDQGYGRTPARALCFAALRASGVEVEDDGEEGP